MTLKRISIFTVICLFCLGLIVSPTMAFKGTYKVGAVFSVTGRTSFLGDPEKKSLIMYVNAINTPANKIPIGCNRPKKATMIAVNP